MELLDTEYRDDDFLVDRILLLIGPGSSLVASRRGHWARDRLGPPPAKLVHIA